MKLIAIAWRALARLAAPWRALGLANLHAANPISPVSATDPASGTFTKGNSLGLEHRHRHHRGGWLQHLHSKYRKEFAALYLVARGP